MTGGRLYLLSQQLFHGFSQLRCADHPVAVGVELKSRERRRSSVLHSALWALPLHPSLSPDEDADAAGFVLHAVSPSSPP